WCAFGRKSSARRLPHVGSRAAASTPFQRHWCAECVRRSVRRRVARSSAASIILKSGRTKPFDIRRGSTDAGVRLALPLRRSESTPKRSSLSSALPNARDREKQRACSYHETEDRDDKNER